MIPNKDLPRLTAHIEQHGSAEGFVKSRIKKRSQEESLSQRAVIKWWLFSHRQFGVGDRCLHSVPNGGYRGKITASIMKEEGLRRGVFDLKLNVARKGFHGLWLEMKARDGVVSKDQEEFRSEMERQGYCCDVAWSSFQAINIITTYLT